MDHFQQDLTHGNVGKQLLRFAMPFLLSNFIQALYSLADVLIVSWFVGATGVSGVGMGGQISQIVLSLVSGLSVAGTVMIAQFVGAKRDRDMRETVSTLISFYYVAAAVFTVLLIVLAEPLLHAIKAPAESFYEAKVYLIICMVGTIFIFLYNGLAAILRGMGDSKRPLWFVAIAAGTNVVLDLLLVGVLKMGAAGAAIATVAAQALSVVLCIVYLKKRDFVFDFKFKSFSIKKDKLLGLLKLGLPNSVQQTLVSISFLFLSSIVNQFGVNASAAANVAGKLGSLAILPCIALGAAVSSMAGQNLGAGLPERAKATARHGVGISMAITVVIFALVQLFPQTLLSIFQPEPEVMELAVMYIRASSLEYLFLAVLMPSNGLIIGSGHTLIPMTSAIISSVAVRVPLAYLFSLTLGYGLFGVGLGTGLAGGAGMIFSLCYLATGLWRRGDHGRGKPAAEEETC